MKSGGSRVVKLFGGQAGLQPVVDPRKVAEGARPSGVARHFHGQIVAPIHDPAIDQQMVEPRAVQRPKSLIPPRPQTSAKGDA